MKINTEISIGTSVLVLVLIFMVGFSVALTAVDRYNHAYQAVMKSEFVTTSRAREDCFREEEQGKNHAQEFFVVMPQRLHI